MVATNLITLFDMFGQASSLSSRIIKIIMKKIDILMLRITLMGSNLLPPQ